MEASSKHRAKTSGSELQETFRRMALALPCTYEDIHRRRPAFRVEKRIFAMLGVAGNSALFAVLARENVAVVKLDREDQLNLVACFKAALQSTEKYGHHGWTYVRMNKLDRGALALILQCAWLHVAPARLRRRLEPQRETR